MHENATAGEGCRKAQNPYNPGGYGIPRFAVAPMIDWTDKKRNSLLRKTLRFSLISA